MFHVKQILELEICALAIKRRGGWVHVIPFGEEERHDQEDGPKCPCGAKEDADNPGMIIHYPMERTDDAA